MAVSVRLYRRGDAEPFAERVLTEDVVVGRSREATLRIDDISVSRRHCQLRNTAYGWVIEDLPTSTCGLTMAGGRVASHLLCDGDRVEVGAAELEFLERALPHAHEGPPAGVTVGAGAIEQVKMGLAGSGVPQPPVPAALVARAWALDRWRCTTRGFEAGLCGQVRGLVAELRRGAGESLLAFGLDARGNLPPMMIYLAIDGPLALLLELDWASPHFDRAEAAQRISAAWREVVGLQALQPRLAQVLGVRERLVVAASDLQGSAWIDGLGRPGSRAVLAPDPLAALVAARAWARERVQG